MFLHAGYKKKGILVTADMGYGKSAFISHLFCAHEGDIGYSMKEKIIAYHLCKFDVLSTKNPALFIRRLVGMIANEIPEFGSAVSMQPNTSIIFDKHLCEHDPNGCFDQGFLFPIRSTKTRHDEQRLIVIDALDECSENEGRQNRISELLRQRANELPEWIALLVTSRNTSNTRLSKDILHMHLEASDKRNSDDIKKYVEQKIASQDMVTKLKHVFGIRSHAVLIQKLVNSSGGNFLFLTHAFEYWYSCNDSVKEDNVPDSLDRIYELNFERIFGTDENNFKNAKLVLEVICASFHRISIKELHHILMIQNSTFVSSVSVRMTLDQLSMFVKNDGSVLMFTHMSIRNWLLSEDNTKFSISIENGASMLSEYLLHELQIKGSEFNFTQLVLQVIRTSNKAIEERYISITQNYTKEIVETNTLHEIVNSVDSPEAIDLVIRHYQNIDQRNKKNLTATSIAASKGHLKSLQRLINLGADLNITIGTKTETGYLEYNYYQFAESSIDNYKVNHFPGYKLLHFASQFGQISVVEFILSKQTAQMRMKTYLGNLPFHLACEFGKKELVEYFIVKQNMTDYHACLYYAAKKQHKTVVQFIINLNNLSFRCISERDANEAFSAIRYSRKVGNLMMTNDHLVRLQDVWWKLRQDSPLHVSVRNGNLRIFKLISSAIPLALDCVDAGGLTPFLTSISYQETNIFKLLVKDRFTDVCSPQSDLMQIFRDTFNNIQITCEQGQGLSHFLALSGTKEMIDHTMNNITQLQLRARDNQGISPLHLAACSGNIEFLRIAHRLGADFDIMSENGSTPFHSAVSCRSYRGLFVFSNLPDKRDHLGMGLGLYLVKDKKITSFDHTVEEDSNEIELYVLKLLNKNTDFITNRDVMKRNIFHHALFNGHYHITKFLLNSRPKLSTMLLQQKDGRGNTPFEYAISGWDTSRNGSSKNYIFPDECFYIDLFRNQGCLDATDLKRLMSPIELSLLYVMMHARNTKLYSVFSSHFGKLVLKSKMYLVPYILVWAADEKHNIVNFKQEVMYAINRDPEPYNILSIVLLSPGTIFHCDKKTDPPLHALLKHMDKIFQTIGKNNSDRFLKEMCRSREGEHVLLNYLDKAGMSLIEKAVKDKALLFLNHLVDICREQLLNSKTDFNKLLKEIIFLNLNTKSHRQEIDRRQKIRTNILMKSDSQNLKENHSSQDNGTPKMKVLRRIKRFVNILNKHFQMEYVVYQDLNNMSEFMLYNHQLFHYDDQYLKTEQIVWERKDKLTEKILVNFKNHIDLNIFCLQKSTFSLIHLLAAGNMYRSIAVLKDMVPTKILDCRNKHGVTPLYLAKVFEAQETVQSLARKTALVLPSKTFEETLLFKLLSNFVDSNIQHPLYFLQNHETPFTLLRPHRFIRLIKALQNAQKFSILYKQIFLARFPDLKAKYLKFLYSALSVAKSLTSKSLSYIKLYSCYNFKTFFDIYQYMLKSIFMFDVVFPKYLAVYSEIWQNVSLFKNFESCSIMKENFNTILKIQMLTNRLISFFMQTKHNLLFNFAIKEVKLTFPREIILFRQARYFTRVKKR